MPYPTTGPFQFPMWGRPSPIYIPARPAHPLAQLMAGVGEGIMAYTKAKEERRRYEEEPERKKQLLEEEAYLGGILQGRPELEAQVPPEGSIRIGKHILGPKPKLPEPQALFDPKGRIAAWTYGGKLYQRKQDAKEQALVQQYRLSQSQGFQGTFDQWKKQFVPSFRIDLGEQKAIRKLKRGVEKNPEYLSSTITSVKNITPNWDLLAPQDRAERVAVYIIGSLQGLYKDKNVRVEKRRTTKMTGETEGKIINEYRLRIGNRVVKTWTSELFGD